MSNIGPVVTMSGTATTTETPIAIPSSFTLGVGNKDGSRPTPRPKGTFLKAGARITNQDATNALIVRINNQANVTTVKAATSIDLPNGVIWALTVKSSAATVAFDIVGS